MRRKSRQRVAGEGRMTPKERIFVKEIKNGLEPVDAAKIAYSGTTNPSARASEALARPRVQRNLGDALEKNFPEYDDKFALLTKQFMERAANEGTLKEQGEALKIISEILGFRAPKQTEIKKLSAKVKLPGAD